MVRNTTLTPDELNDGACGVSMPRGQALPEQSRAPHRSFIVANTEDCDPLITREVIARVDADFARIFGSRE
jgi:hypothetical protein